MEEEHTYELPNFKDVVASCDVNSQYGIPSNSTSGALATPHQDNSKLKKPVCSWLCMCALVGFILVGSAAFASLALTVWNSSQVNHQSAKLEVEHMIMKLQNTISGFETFVNGSISEYMRRIMQLQNSTFVDGSIFEYERKINQLQIFVNNLNELQASVSGRTDILLRLNPAASCSHVLQLNPSSPSGYYWIRSSNGSAVHVYCDFNRLCGCDGPSTWTRVAFLNMSDPNQVCPSNWNISSPVRACGRTQNRRCGCNSVFYSTYGMTYTRVCGRIIAYQHGDPDGYSSCSNQIDGSYMDGVSLTHGSVGSRQHIWSFVNARYESSICACISRNISFVGNNFFCDSGNNGSTSSSSTFYSGHPLWDGQGCGPSSTCCQFNNPPWFCKTLPQSTTDDLEVRICKDGTDEDIPLQLVELYVG